MSATELKNRLHASIDSIDDDELLNSVYDILENGKKFPDGLLSNKLFLDKLEIGMEDIKNGRIVTLEESNSKIDEWLKK